MARFARRPADETSTRQQAFVERERTRARYNVKRKKTYEIRATRVSRRGGRRHAGQLIRLRLRGRSGSATQGGATKWTVGRTAWGDPDFQGKWAIAETGTPMERSKEFANREFLTDEELATKIANARKRSAPEGDEDERSALKKPRRNMRRASVIRSTSFWVDGGQRQITPWKRTSLVIDPPDGRILPSHRKRSTNRRRERPPGADRGEADGWEDRNFSERCLQTGRFTRIGAASSRSSRDRDTWRSWSSLNTYEPIIVPLDKRPLPAENVRKWLGIPRGHWDGATLVVETTHINGKQDGGP